MSLQALNLPNRIVEAQKGNSMLDWDTAQVNEESGDYNSNTMDSESPSVLERLDRLKAEAWNTSAKLQLEKLQQLTELMQQSGEGPLSADVFQLYAKEIMGISEALNLCIEGLWSHIDDS